MAADRPLMIGLVAGESSGDNLGAARAFEDYARRFPGEEDREKTHFLAGEQYEQVSAGNNRGVW